ncbi:transporter [Pokkaliibacter plantistimulans]|uniref:Transporter n=1 Tax=Proteobacteria bacterium 228 TaxID=2083153 RepID=A0A2S5KT10_9PROT|nr:AEC family transporter [Pokkaliibacter plantistimulans]PPC77991.1 transporter [Pokkaliibacter plantistimulans]
MLERIFLTVFPVVAVVLIGSIYGRLRRPDVSVANQINMELFVPALLISVLAGKNFQLTDYSQLAIMAAAIVLGSGLVLLPLCRLPGVSLKTFLPPMMFNNTGNMGIPLLVFAFGDKALPAAVVLFIVEMLLHFTVGIYMLDHRTSPRQLLRMPITLATLLGLALSFSGLHLPQWFYTPLDMIGQISIPLMLFTLGIRLTHINLKDWHVGVLGAIACPASGLLLAWIVQTLWPLPAEQWAYLIVFAALPPAVLNYMLAEQFRQEPAKVASIVMLGNIASLVIIPLALMWAI